MRCFGALKLNGMTQGDDAAIRHFDSSSRVQFILSLLHIRLLYIYPKCIGRQNRSSGSTAKHSGERAGLSARPTLRPSTGNKPRTPYKFHTGSLTIKQENTSQLVAASKQLLRFRLHLAMDNSDAVELGN